VRRWVAVVVLAGTLVASAACGVPSGGPAVDLGNAPTAGPNQVVTAQQPPNPDSVRSPIELVTKYFAAAAWGNTDAGDRPKFQPDAQNSVRAFLTADAAKRWQPGAGVRVARVVVNEQPKPVDEGALEFTATIVPIGVLLDNGQLDTRQGAGDPFTFPFKVVRLPGGGRRLDSAPNDMWLSVDALDQFYVRQPIYFWDKVPVLPTLVPDLRYMPKVVSEAKRPDVIMKWLRDGPSDWLQGVVDFLPPAIELKDKIVTDQQRLVVNLTNKAAGLDPAALQRLEVQLRWSFGATDRSDAVDLRVENTPSGVSAADFLSANRAVRDSTKDPDKFCVVNGKARSTKPDGGPAVLANNANAGVVSAAITADRSRAALVVGVPGDKKLGRLLFLLSTGRGDTSTSTTVDSTVEGAFTGRPVWIFRPETRVLVIVNGKIVSVAQPLGTTVARPTPVTVPAELEPVSALSVAPDGRRVALVSSGPGRPPAVYVAPLGFPVNSEGQLFIGEPRKVVTSLAVPRAVGWGSETTLVVGGDPLPGSQNSVFEVSIDGAREQPRPDTGSLSLPVKALTTRPANPLGPSDVPAIMFEANGIAYDVFGQVVDNLKLELTPTPTPSASSNGSNSTLTAPFFPD
jgi:hypothetical protein